MEHASLGFGLMRGCDGMNRAKVGRLVGVLGRAGAVVGKQSLLMLYNALVLPHLQYCLMAWGDFEGNRNKKLWESLLKLHKGLAGIITGRQGRYHSDPILAELKVLKVGDLYRQQLRLHAWKFWNGKLPPSQALMLSRVRETHQHNTRYAEAGISLNTRDHSSIGFRIPKEWETLSKTQKEIKSLATFKKNSRQGFISEYRDFICTTRDCFVCRSGDPLTNTEFGAG